MLGLKFLAKSLKGGAAPTAEASQYKLFATEFSKKLANASMDVARPRHAAAGRHPRRHR